MIIAEVCANVTANNIVQNYTYLVPERLKFLSLGWRVSIPFGHRTIDGFVISVREVNDSTIFPFELKEIYDVIDDEAWFTPKMINEAQWLAEFYLCPLSQTMGLFMPGRHGKKIETRIEKIYKLAKPFDAENFRRSTAKLKFLKLLEERGELRTFELAENKIPSSAVKSLIDLGLVEVEERRVLRDSYSKIRTLPKTFELTAEQVAAIKSVEKFILARKFQGFLLYGVTSSGKTQVYIELAKITRRLGRRVIILVPEIALTGQIVSNFRAHFSDVAVLHSRLSLAERSDTFHRIRNGNVGVVIGARSALFTPVDNVGLIVVDEEQDYSYKQENAPRYHARIVAEEFAKRGDSFWFSDAEP